MELLFSLVGLLVGTTLTYVVEVRRGARERREQLFADALSAVVVDRANAHFPCRFEVSILSADDRAGAERDLAIDAYKRRALGIVERRAALARAVPFAPEIEPYVDLIEMADEQQRAVRELLLARLAAVRRPFRIAKRLGR